jgi:membrane protein implicated in regulation of membrane protease activity
MKFLLKKCAEIALALFIIVWIGAVAFAENAPAAYSSDWHLFLLLIGIIQALVGYIYISGQKKMDKKNDEFRADIKDLYDRKMDKVYHDDICPNPPTARGRERR